MTTLFDASLALAKILGNVRGSTATGGSTTTIVDSTHSEANDFWNDGTIWITSGNAANSSRKVLDWVLSSTLYSVTALSSAVANGNTYNVLVGDWPRDKLWDFLNNALRDIGDVPAKSVSLTTVADQEAYTLPAGVFNVITVEMATSLTTPYVYVPQVGTWYEQAGSLYFKTNKEPKETGYILRLTYASPHAVMDADADTISDYVHLSRLVWAAAVYAWQWRIQMSKEDEPMYGQQLAYAVAIAEREKMLHPIHMPVQAAKNSL